MKLNQQAKPQEQQPSGRCVICVLKFASLLLIPVLNRIVQD